MAPNLAQLTKLIAALLDYPWNSAQVLMRVGRESVPPVFPTMGRGRHAAPASSLNAADLILAMMVCPSPAKVPGYVFNFGDLRHAGEERGPEMHHLLDSYGASDALHLEGTFRESIARVLDALGDPEFARSIVKSQRRDARGNYQPPNFSITVWDTIMKGAIRVDAVEHGFAHELIAGITKDMAPDEIERRYAEEALVSRKYYRRIFSMKAIGTEVLKPIAEALSGRNFRAMLEEAAKDA